MNEQSSGREKTRLRVQRHRQIVREIDSQMQRHTNQRGSENIAESSSSDCPFAIGGEIIDRNVVHIDRSQRNDAEPSDDELLHNNTTEEESINSEDADQLIVRQENVPERAPDGRQEVEQLREWALECNIQQVHLDKLLKILRVRLIPELPKSSKTFLKTASMPHAILDVVDNDGTFSGQYVYFGIANGLQKCINPILHERGEILLQFNVDGLPIFSSSKKQFWPILCKVFTNPDIYKPFLVAIFCGETKPTCVNSYLREFVIEINALKQNGIVICRKNFTIHIQSFICDTPARSFMKLTKGHCGYSACERCTVRGIRTGQRMVYADIDCQERTDESFRRMQDEEHHNGRSVLLSIEPPIDLIKTFVLDFMHLCCVGVMKRLYLAWLSGDLKVRLRPRYKRELSRIITAIRKHIVCEFQRKLRTTLHAGQLKATELRFILLYCGPVMLKDFLSKNLYNHFLLLHVACRILCTEKLAQKYNERAKSYLRKFVMLLPRLYGENSVVLNYHNLIHLADDAKNMKCSLMRISAFPFENFLGKLKKVVRTPNRPLAQVCRRMHEKSFLATEKALPKSRVEILQKNYDAVDGFINILKIRYMDFILTTDSPNNVVLLTNRKIFKINKIFSAEESPLDIQLEGVVWKVKCEIFQYPTSSANLDMWELRTVPSGATLTIPVGTIDRKMMKLEFPIRQNEQRLRVFAVPLLHE